MEAKIPTLKEIADKLNLSVSTVSRALKGHPAIGLRTTTKVQKLAKELGYESNRLATSFKQQKSFIVGVIMPNLREEFFSQAITGIEGVAEGNNYSVLIGQSHDIVEKEAILVNAMKNQRVDGLLVSITKQTGNLKHFEALERYNIPVVYFDRVPNTHLVHKVSSNFSTSTRQVMEFLISNGHKRIGIINGPGIMKSCVERVDTYFDVLTQNNIMPDDSLLISTDLTRQQVREASRKLLSLDNPPTAIITINDYVALDAIQFAKEKGLKINRDIVFVSYANLPITSYMEFPPLASVEQYPRKQAEKAAEILFKLIENKRNNSNDRYVQFENIMIEGKLIVSRQNSQ